mgnify:FL=1
MVQYNCDKCGFLSANKKDYTRHVKTRKHLEKVEEETNISVTTPDDTPRHIEKNAYVCKYCNNNYTRSSSLMRHMNKCLKINNNDICVEKDIEIKDIKLTNLKNELKRIQKEAKEKEETFKQQLEKTEKQLITYEQLLKSMTTPQTIIIF